MKSSTILLSALSLIWLRVIVCNAQQNEVQIPDSIISIGHTYTYCLADPQKAQQIFDSVRQRNLAKDYELDWAQADLYYNTGKYRLATYYFERVAMYEAVKSGLGNKDSVVHYLKESLAITDSLRIREQKELVSELAVIYESHEKDTLLQKQQDTIVRRNIFLVSTIIIAVLLALILALIVYNWRKTKENNRAMIRQIKEMQLYKKKLFSAKHMSEVVFVAQKEVSDLAKIEYNLFASFQNLMLTEKLYHNPNLTRDNLTTLLGTNKNLLIKAIQANTMMSFTGYVNTLRLEESIILLEHSNKDTIENIAEKVGFGTARTFYRQFKDRYGMSPTEYRDLARKEMQPE